MEHPSNPLCVNYGHLKIKMQLTILRRYLIHKSVSDAISDRSIVILNLRSVSEVRLTSFLSCSTHIFVYLFFR